MESKNIGDKIDEDKFYDMISDSWGGDNTTIA